ncbi:MAG: aldehyde dehydrogenase family protein, partial [Actinomycetota bacterium]|nr:aldehyde dehydrogenase family protein [Actinomycetota bacterium]
TCMAAERVLVAAPVYDEFVAHVERITAALTVGTGSDANVGPVARPQQLDVVEPRLAAAIAAGAKVRIGGRRVSGTAGLFEPTVVTDVDPRSELWREESFAPVMAIARVADDAQAVAVANHSEFGLNASVHTRDRARARAIASQLVTGGVNINDAMTGAALPALPFGGVRGSGYGRLQGPEGLRELSQVTSVVEPVSLRLPSAVGMMFTGRRPKRSTVERVIRAVYGRG